MNQDPEEFERQKRLSMLHFIIALIIQVMILYIYYFKEKQEVLAFPMVLGIFVTISGIISVSQLGKR